MVDGALIRDFRSVRSATLSSHAFEAAEEAFGKVKSVQSPGKSAKRASDPCKNKGWRETESGREDSGIGVAQK